MSEGDAQRLISVVVPVYNEAENICPCLLKLSAALKDHEHEILICYDFEEDATLPAIRSMNPRPPHIRFVRNDLGKGVSYALQAGFKGAQGDVVVTTMADLSDSPETIPLLAAKIREGGAHVVSGSRYMKGGTQSGGGLVKATLSRVAGLTLCWFGRVGTHDATTNFRAYRTDFLKQVEVESRMGFEVALELTVKAHLMGLKVDEVPADWQDRSAGESRFRVWAWMPSYLRWYMKVMWVPCLVGLGLFIGLLFLLVHALQ